MQPRTERRNRRQAQRRGGRAEYIAALFLRLKGYRILAMRYRTRLGEIDIVARKGNLAVFVEVKARADELRAVEAVGASSRRRIRDSAAIWLSRQGGGAELSSRFDIVAVVPWRLPRHFRDAF